MPFIRAASDHDAVRLIQPCLKDLALFTCFLAKVNTVFSSFGCFGPQAADFLIIFFVLIRVNSSSLLSDQSVWSESADRGPSCSPVFLFLL